VKRVLLGAVLAMAVAGAGRAASVAPLLVVSSDYTKWSVDHVFTYGRGGPLRALAPGSTAAASPDGKLVAFIRDDALWTVRADGRLARRVAALGGEPWFGRSPVWSPDGRRVAVQVGDHVDLVELETRVVTRIEASAAAISPDGAQVAYVDHKGLEVADASGSNPHLVVPGWTQGIGVAWSPDGRWIAFSAWRADGAARVVVVRPDGTGLRELGGLGPGIPGAPAWSRDGRIAWRASPRVQVATPTGSVRLLARVRGVPASLAAPAWSPGGRLVALRTTASGVALVPTMRGRVRVLHPPTPAQSIQDSLSWAGERVVFSARKSRSDLELSLVRVDGSGLRALTRNGFADRDPTWAPDGRTVAFSRVGARRHGIYRIGVPGGTVRRLTDGDDRAPAFAPDGRSIAFVRGNTISLLDLRTRRISALATTKIRPRQLFWTKDATAIVFGDEYSLKRLDVATGQASVIDVGGDVFRPVLSPDGTRIAFLSYRDPHYYRDPDAWGIFVASLDGTNVRKVSTTGKFGPTSWSADGTTLVVTDGSRLELVDLASGRATALFNGGHSVGAAFHP
jgi:Tol biopolymer transport system component